MNIKFIKQSTISKYISVWTALSISGLLIFFVFLHWNSINVPFGRDQGEYAYSAWLLREGLTPYVDSFLQKPPMIIYTYAVAQLINPGSYWPPRILACLFLLFTIALIGLIARREFGPGTALMAMFLAVRMTVLPRSWGFGANTEVFMLLPLVLVLALYVWKKENANRWHWFFAGLFASLAMLYKPICILVLLFIFCVWLAETLRVKNIKITMVNFLFAILGMTLALTITLSYYVYRNAFGSMWDSVVAFNYYYQKYFYSSGSKFFMYHMKILWSEWWILFLLFAWFMIKRPARWWFYLGLFLSALITVYQNPNGCYYFLLMPFWVLISVSAILSMIDEMKFKNTIWIRTAFIIVVIIFMTWPIRHQLFMSSDRFALQTYGRINPFIESPMVAEYVKQQTSPEDYVFIAGSEPQILFYAERKSSTRHILMYPLMINTPLALEYQREAIRDLEAHPPKLMLLCCSPASWLIKENSPVLFRDYFRELTDSKYQLEAGFIQNDNVGYWQKPPISNDQLASCSFLMYKKI